MSRRWNQYYAFFICTTLEKSGFLSGSAICFSGRLYFQKIWTHFFCVSDFKIIVKVQISVGEVLKVLVVILRQTQDWTAHLFRSDHFCHDTVHIELELSPLFVKRKRLSRVRPEFRQTRNESSADDGIRRSDMRTSVKFKGWKAQNLVKSAVF